MNTELMFSSANENWETPPEVFNPWNTLFNFDLDVCADWHNAKCTDYFDKTQNALERIWTGRCWMNPPYGRHIGKWVKKAHDSVLVDSTAELVCCLLPARTDTKWFHEYIWDDKNDCSRPGVYVKFLQGRVKFLENGEPKHPAPFPSMIVVFRW